MRRTPLAVPTNTSPIDDRGRDELIAGPELVAARRRLIRVYELARQIPRIVGVQDSGISSFRPPRQFHLCCRPPRRPEWSLDTRSDRARYRARTPRPAGRS